MHKVFLNKLSIIIYFLIATIIIISIATAKKEQEIEIQNVNFVLIGKDGKDDDEVVDRGDAIMLVNFKAVEKEVNIISIPRDSLVEIPCGKNSSFMDKINHAYAYGEINWKNQGGGSVCLASTVASLFATPPLFYALANFGDVKEVVDQIGGIDVIPRFSFCVSSTCFVKNKTIHLDGEKTLLYARHRKTLPYGDASRTIQHRQIMVALIKKFQTLSQFNKLKVASYIASKVKTNAPISSLLKMIKLNSNDYKISTFTIKGSDVYQKGIYYYQIDNNDLRKLKETIKE